VETLSESLGIGLSSAGGPVCLLEGWPGILLQQHGRLPAFKEVWSTIRRFDNSTAVNAAMQHPTLG